MSQTEFSTSTQVKSPETVNEEVFSPDARIQALDIVARAQWWMVRAIMQPAKNMVAWLGFDTWSRDWGEIVKAKAEIRRLSMAVNDAHTHDSKVS
jgi:hypothetical protein